MNKLHIFLLLASLPLGLKLFGQTRTWDIPAFSSWVNDTIYIDTDWPTNESGASPISPLNTLTGLTYQNNKAYLIKRGTSVNVSKINIYGRDSIIIGAYGTGDLPKIISSTYDVKIIDAGGENILITDLEIMGTNSARAGVAFSYYSGNNNMCQELYCINLDIHNTKWAIRTDGSATFGHKLVIDSCVCYDNGDDNIFIQNMDSTEVSNCNLSNASMSTASGDNLQFAYRSYYMHIHDNTMDKSSTSGKQCLIIDFDTIGVGSSIVEKNIFITPNTLETIWGSGIYYDAGGERNICRYNKFSGNSAAIRVRNSAKVDIYYNIFEMTSDQVLDILTSTNNVWNNIIRNWNNAGRGIVTQTYSNAAYNNIFESVYNPLDGSNITHDYNNFYNTTYVPTEANGLSSNPAWIDTVEYKLSISSPLINSGTNVGLNSDFYGDPIISSPDIGIHEYQSTSTIIDTILINTVDRYSNFEPGWINMTGNSITSDTIIIYKLNPTAFFNLGEISINDWPDNVAETYHYSTNSTIDLVIKNISSNYLYDIQVLSNREGTEIRNQYTICQNDTVTIDVMDETNNVAYFDNVQAVGDSILITTVPISSSYSYINGIKIFVKQNIGITTGNYNLASYAYATQNSNNYTPSSFKVYPNPFKEKFVVKLPDMNETYSLKLIDIHGRIVLFQNNIKGNLLKVENNGFQSGIYFLTIINSKGDVFNDKLILNK